jgi:excisionase family DNA binding protein
MNVSRDHGAEREPGNTISLPAPDRGPQVERLAIAPRLLRLRDAAEYLSMGTKALRQLIHSRKLPYVQLDKNSPFLVDRRDLDKFIERHKVGAQ